MQRTLHLGLDLQRVDPSTVDKSTVFSPCRKWRYTLWRHWGGLFDEGDRYIAFLCLNPSTADETKDDPTVRRCIDFANRFGFASFCMLNIFAWRDTDPRGMKRQPDPVGPDNDRHILRVAAGAEFVIAAWGTHGRHRDRDLEVRRMLPNLKCLKVTKDGHPQHPLYLDAELLPIELPALQPPTADMAASATLSRSSTAMAAA